MQTPSAEKKTKAEPWKILTKHLSVHPILIFLVFSPVPQEVTLNGNLGNIFWLKRALHLTFLHLKIPVNVNENLCLKKFEFLCIYNKNVYQNQNEIASKKNKTKDYITEQTCSCVSTIARRYLNSKILLFIGCMSAFLWPGLFPCRIKYGSSPNTPYFFWVEDLMEWERICVLSLSCALLATLK